MEVWAGNLGEKEAVLAAMDAPSCALSCAGTLGSTFPHLAAVRSSPHASNLHLQLPAQRSNILHPLGAPSDSFYFVLLRVAWWRGEQTHLERRHGWALPKV